ncbi:MAG: TetR/AcrR family transcriptional regulator [Xanthobacteraceae bacterium]|jgi:AcrR family transcriptional regulator|uniref:TetR/AcrR family transcriptional regulator n=1 Tax=Pseudolabrys sp. TaxID=1960880 RepID=UPI003D11563A
MPRDADVTRQRIIQAAQKLYYGQGIRSASVDAIAARAGVTKKTFYYHFRSKDDVIAVSLDSRDQPTLDIVSGWLNGPGPLAQRLVAVFDGIAPLAANPRWKGCGFLRTVAELASTPGHPAVKAGAAHKKRMEAMFAAAFRAEGLSKPEERALQVMILFDGALTEMFVHRDPVYARSAGRMAAMLAS